MMLWVEIIGGIAMVLLVSSFLMKKIFWIRLINLFASSIFVAYSILTNSRANALANFILIIINTVYLIKLSRNKNKTTEENKEQN
jgi:membrane-bound ClpP family serine protease